MKYAVILKDRRTGKEEKIDSIAAISREAANWIAHDIWDGIYDPSTEMLQVAVDTSAFFRPRKAMI